VCEEGGDLCGEMRVCTLGVCILPCTWNAVRVVCGSTEHDGICSRSNTDTVGTRLGAPASPMLYV